MPDCGGRRGPRTTPHVGSAADEFPLRRLCDLGRDVDSLPAALSALQRHLAIRLGPILWEPSLGSPLNAAVPTGRANQRLTVAIG
jgi:hypothetical protein